MLVVYNKCVGAIFIYVVALEKNGYVYYNDSACKYTFSFVCGGNIYADKKG